MHNFLGKVADEGVPRPRLPRKDYRIASNLQALSAGIALCRTGAGALQAQAAASLVQNSDAIARAVYDAPEERWRRWDDRPPHPEDGEIVGRDALGFYHLATHLVGGNGMWVEYWMPVPFDVGSRV